MRAGYSAWRKTAGGARYPRLVTRFLVAGALAALAFAPLGAAASPAVKTFTDASNEHKGAPDIRKVSIYQSGDVLNISAQVANMPKLMSAGFVSFTLNTDGNAKTGSIRGGDYVVYVDLSTGSAIFEKWNGKKYAATKKIASPTKTLVGKTGCGIEFNLANFGWPKTVGFALVVGKVTGASSALTDTAPDKGLWTYAVTQQIAGFNFDFTPGAPKAGSVFSAISPTLTLSDNSKVTPTTTRCSAKLAGNVLAPIGGAGSCRWKIPALAAGAKLVITPTVTYQGQRVSFDAYSFKVV
jgi:hypothetical protein